MNLFDAAKLAREKADASMDPTDHALAASLEAALDAQARYQLAELEAEHETTRLPSAAEAGYVTELHIEKPDDPQ